MTMLSTKAVVDNDPDVEMIEVTIHLKEGKEVKGLSAFVLERAVLNWAAKHIPSWFEYNSKGAKY